MVANHFHGSGQDLLRCYRAWRKPLRGPPYQQTQLANWARYINTVNALWRYLHTQTDRFRVMRLIHSALSSHDSAEPWFVPRPGVCSPELQVTTRICFPHQPLPCLIPRTFFLRPVLIVEYMSRAVIVHARPHRLLTARATSFPRACFHRDVPQLPFQAKIATRSRPGQKKA